MSSEPVILRAGIELLRAMVAEQHGVAVDEVEIIDARYNGPFHIEVKAFVRGPVEVRFTVK